MRQIRQNSTANVMVFAVDSADHVTPKPGLTLTITASKNGGAFSSISPTVTDRGNGWYSIALTSSHTDTLGDLAIRATASGADDINTVCRVVAVDHADSAAFGLSRLDVAVSSRSTLTASDVWSHATRTLSSFGSLVSDVWSHSTRTLTGFGSLVSDIWSHGTRTITSFGSLVADVWSHATRTLTSVADSSGVTTLLSRLTSGRASNLDNLDAAVSSRLASSAYTSPPSVSSIADAVWDETLGTRPSGSTGAALAAAGSAGDPWTTALPGPYSSNQAGAILAGIKNKTDLISPSAILQVSAGFSATGALTIIAGDTTTFSMTVPETLSLLDLVTFSIKRSATDLDEDAVLLLDSDQGLLRIGGAPPTPLQTASMTLSGNTDVSILLGRHSTRAIDHGQYVYSLAVRRVNDEVKTHAQGLCVVVSSGIYNA